MINIGKLNKYFIEKFKLDKWYKISPIYLINERILSFWMWVFEVWEDGEALGRKKEFNLHDPVEKALGRINWYYEVLSNVGETETKNEWKENWMLLDVVEYDKEENIKKCLEYAKKWNNEDTLDLLTWSGNGIEEWVYRIVYDCVDDVIYYVYNDMDMKEEEKIEWKLTKEEFNLLMQIYYGIYDDEMLKKKLEEKERKWEYNKYKSILNK